MDIEARREARRRRILEQSENRLRKITGVEQKKGSEDLDGFKCTTEHAQEHNDSPIELARNDSGPTVNRALTDQKHILSIHSLLQYRVWIVSILAVICNISFLLFESVLLDSIFVNLFCFELICLLCMKNEPNDDLDKYLVLFLRGRFQKHIGLILKYLSTIKTVFRDVSIYFFVFVLLLLLQSAFNQDLRQDLFSL